MELTLQQKLALSKRPNHLTLFHDNMFVRAYNESAYLLSQRLNRKLKPHVFKMRHAPFEMVVMVSLPKLSVFNWIPNLQKTVFGYELHEEYNLANYANWLQKNKIYCA